MGQGRAAISAQFRNEWVRIEQVAGLREFTGHVRGQVVPQRGPIGACCTLLALVGGDDGIPDAERAATRVGHSTGLVAHADHIVIGNRAAAQAGLPEHIAKGDVIRSGVAAQGGIGQSDHRALVEDPGGVAVGAVCMHGYPLQRHLAAVGGNAAAKLLGKIGAQRTVYYAQNTQIVDPAALRGAVLCQGAVGDGDHTRVPGLDPAAHTGAGVADHLAVHQLEHAAIENTTPTPGGVVLIKTTLVRINLPKLKMPPPCPACAAPSYPPVADGQVLQPTQQPTRILQHARLFSPSR